MSNIEIEQCRVYVACLASYNNGRLYGKWIALNQPLEAIKEEVYKMLSESPTLGAEEFEIHDYEGFCSYKLSKYCGLEEAKAIADFIGESGPVAAELLNYYGLDEAIEKMENDYHGEYRSESDYAEQLFNDCFLESIPDNLQNYIDYEAFARDLFIDDCFSVEVGYSVHVFSNH
jgi:antirestriction protein